MLSDGQVHDSNAALDALSGIDILGSNIIGDKAYGAKKSEILLPNIMLNIPFRRKKVIQTLGFVVLGFTKSAI